MWIELVTQDACGPTYVMRPAFTTCSFGVAAACLGQSRLIAFRHSGVEAGDFSMQQNPPGKRPTLQ